MQNPPSAPLKTLRRIWLVCLTSVFAFTQRSRADIVDTVDFNSGALTDRFSVNIEPALTSPYVLAANGLASTQGVDLIASGDATLVYKSKAYNLSAIPSLDVACYFKKQATNTTAPTALMLGIEGSTTARMTGYVGTTEDSYAALRLQSNGTGLRFQWLTKTGANVGGGASASSNLSLTNGNWYQLRANFQRIDATTIRISGSVYNSDANGSIGTLVGSYGPFDGSIADIAGDSEVWAAMRGFPTAGADAWDNLSITQNGVNEVLPATPANFTVTAWPGYRVGLAWTDASNNENNFIVSRSATENGVFTDIATLFPNTTSYSDDTAGVPQRWFYKVRAVNTAGSSSSQALRAVTSRTQYTWKNVAIGGGGYITGIFIHPTEPNLVYVRTDVGGAYRWDPVNIRWIPLVDHIKLDQSNYYNCEGLALDPLNPNVVYYAGGNSFSFGAVLKSTDRGATWTQLPLGGIEMNANGSYHWVGERLVVSPFDSNVILFGTRRDGIQRSADGGSTWTRVTTSPADLGSNTTDGITAVLFDPLTSGVAYAISRGVGVWKSTDSGVTWASIAGSPTDGERMAIGASGALLVAQGSGVSKYASGVWTSSVPGGVAMNFRGISVNPANRNDVIVADSSSAVGGAKTYRSSDGGNTWTQFLRPKDNTVPWFESFRLSNPALAALEFDPTVAGRVWLSDWYAVWHCDNINVASPVFRDDMYGLEEVVTFTLASPSSGALLLSGVADEDGFFHNNGLDVFPTARFNGYQETHSLAVYAGDPQRIARCAGGRTGPYHVFTSTNGGSTWTTTNWSSAVPNSRALVLAVGATDFNNIVAVTDSSLDPIPRMTTNGGTTWQAVTGLPNGPSGVFSTAVPLAADPVTADRFYYYDASSGKVFRSTDKGLNFSQMNAGALLPTTSNTVVLKSLPAASGDLWASLDTLGLYHSTNGGASFSKINSVTRAFRFAFGKAPPNSSTPALYLVGSVTNGSGLGVFRSLDLGQTWSELTDLAEAMGDGPNVVEGSAQEYGLVFIGTGGRGIFYGRPVPTVSVAATSSAAECGPVPGVFTLSRDGDTAQPASVAFTLSGSASNGTDFTASSPVSIPSASSSVPLLITPVADHVAEGSENVTLSLVPSPNYLIGPDATLSIADEPMDLWRMSSFTAAELNQPSVSGDLVDPNGNGLVNLLEYALHGSPKGADSGVRPQMGTSANHLTLSFSRDTANADVIYTVQAGDDLGTWTDLARCANGAAWSIVTAGTTVNETGAGTLKSVMVTDPVVRDASHSKRFLRLNVSR